MIEYTYQKSIAEKDYSDEEKRKILSSISQKINKEFEEQPDYLPGEHERYFTYSLKDISHYEID